MDRGRPARAHGTTSNASADLEPGVGPCRAAVLLALSGSRTDRPLQRGIDDERRRRYSTSDEAVAKQIRSLIKESVYGLTKAYDLEFEIQTTKCSAVTFDESLSLHLSNAAKEVLGSIKVMALEYSRYPSPELTQYLEAVSGTILEIGTGESRSEALLKESIRSGFKTVSWAFLKYLH